MVAICQENLGQWTPAVPVSPKIFLSFASSPHIGFQSKFTTYWISIKIHHMLDFNQNSPHIGFHHILDFNQNLSQVEKRPINTWGEITFWRERKNEVTGVCIFIMWGLWWCSMLIWNNPWDHSVVIHIKVIELPGHIEEHSVRRGIRLVSGIPIREMGISGR